MNIIATIENLQQTWALLFPTSPVPDQRQRALWLTLYPEQTVRAAIAKLAIKQTNGTAPAINLDRFASSIMQRMDRAAGRVANDYTAVRSFSEEPNGKTSA